MNVGLFLRVAAVGVLAVSEIRAQNVPVTGGVTSIQLEAAVFKAPTLAGLQVGQARILAVSEAATVGLVLAGSLGRLRLSRRQRVGFARR